MTTFGNQPFRGFALAGPMHAHPKACAVGTGPSTALATAYMFGQTQARMLFVQTYRLHIDTPSVYATNGSEIAATTWVSIGRGRRYIPAHATHALFELWGSVIGAESTSVYARLVINDGVTTVNGDAVNHVLDARPITRFVGNQTSQFQDNLALVEQRLFSSYTGAAMFQLRGSVSLSTLTLAATMTSITVEAYAVDADTESVSVQLHPYQCHAWWEESHA